MHEQEEAAPAGNGTGRLGGVAERVGPLVARIERKARREATRLAARRP